MFAMQLSDESFNAKLGEMWLRLAPTFVYQWNPIYPGNNIVLTATQAIQSETRESLLKVVERNDKIVWEFVIVANCVVEKTGDQGQFQS